jgi:AP-3 complex subunit beta
VINSFKKGASDLSPYVRKAVSISLVKAYKMDPKQSVSLIEIVQMLLNDKSSVVLGPIVEAWNEICPDRTDLIHRHYRKLCLLMRESDEWAQIQLLQVLDRYCRGHFSDPGLGTVDSDHMLFLTACKALLTSRNPLVVLTVARIYYDGSQIELIELAARSLIRCLNRTKQEQRVLLGAIKAFIQKDPNPWHPYLTSFAVFPAEMNEIKQLKLDILEQLSLESNMNWIVPELKVWLVFI